MDYPINNLDDVVGNYLEDKTIINYETTKLTALGENYGSLMLAMKLKLKNKNSQHEVLELVAKVPPKGEYIKKMFNTPITFRNEINFYKIIVPELEFFLQELGYVDYLDCFPKFYGGRLSLANQNVGDEDAVLLLENLTASGYCLIDRTIGFDFETSKTILKALAQLHAVPIAIKLKKPDQFYKIRKYFSEYQVFDLDSSFFTQFWERFVPIIRTVDSCVEHLHRIRDSFLNTPKQIKNNPNLIREPYATLVHTDAWVNNFMVKGTTSCKMVDFQLYEYGSPARDILFFIYSSIEAPVVEKHYDELIKWYHNCFTDILKDLGCNTEPFTLEEFLKEMQLVFNESEFVHTLMMLEPLYATEETVLDLENLSVEDMVKEKPISNKQLEKTKFLFKDFVAKKLI